jgi:uroporphyrinogen-III synthase
MTTQVRVALFLEDASATAARLRRLGFRVACLPAIEIGSTPVHRPDMNDPRGGEHNGLLQ